MLDWAEAGGDRARERLVTRALSMANTVAPLRTGQVRLTMLKPPMSIGVPLPAADNPRELSFVDTFPITAVTLKDEIGNQGLGYVAGSPDVAPLVSAVLNEKRPSLREMLLGGSSSTWRFGTGASAHTEPVPGAGAVHEAAMAAISLAAWDLLGNQLGVACADLWGRATNEGLDAYYSGFFTTRSTDELLDEAEQAKAENFTRIKMRSSHSLAEDLERITVLAGIYPEPRTIAMDGIWGWSLERALQFVERCPVDLMWLEDPFHYDSDGLTQYARFADLAGPHVATAGEACRSVDELTELLSHGAVNNLLEDVACLGGPLPFLNAADQLIKKGARIGSHLYAGASLQLLAAVGDPLPVEGVAWQDPPFVTTPSPDPSGKMFAALPGLGQQFDYDRFLATGEAVDTLTFPDPLRAP